MLESSRLPLSLEELSSMTVSGAKVAGDRCSGGDELKSEGQQVTGTRLPNNSINTNEQFLVTSVPGTILIRALTDIILLQSSQLHEVDHNYEVDIVMPR